jgi:hypothetical protein
MSERIDLAVIDNNVMNFLFKTNPSLNKKVQFAHFNSQLLNRRKKTFICFNNSALGSEVSEVSEISEILNQGLKKIAINSGNR